MSEGSIVKTGNISEIVEDMFSSMSNKRFEEGNSSSRSTSTGNASYAAIAIAYKGSEGMTKIKDNPQAPFCYGVGTKELVYTKFVPMGFIKDNKPDIKSNLEIYLDKDGNNPATISGFAGYPQYIETAGGISYMNNDREYVNVCQFSGFRLKPSGPIVNTLPNGVISTMYSFDSINSKKFNEPSEPVVNFGTMGTRGEMCVDCIRRGHSVDKDVNGKEISCSTNAYMYVVLTHILSIKRTPRIVDGVTIQAVDVKGLRPISEFFDGEGKPLNNIIICIKLGKLSMRGSWFGKDSPFNITGPNQYYGLLNSLYPSDPSMRDASKHLTAFYTGYAVDKRNKEVSTFGQLHMVHVESEFKNNLDSIGLKSFNFSEESKKAKEFWQMVKPKVDIQVLPEPQSNPVEVVDTSTETGPTKSATPVDSDEDWNSFKFD